MANTGPAAGTPAAVTSMAHKMLSPDGKEALHFHGKDIDGFLGEYETAAQNSSLTDTQKCEGIRIYFSRKQKELLDVLPSFQAKDWIALKKQLESLYTSTAQKKVYQPRDMQKFSAKKRKIMRLDHFDTYRQDFLTISGNLTSRKTLS